MRTLLAGLDWLLDKVTLALLVTLVLVVGLQIFARYVLNHSLYWSEELARYLFIYLVFLGGAVVLRMERHIQVTAFVDLLPPLVRRAILVLGDVLMLGFVTTVLVEGIRLSAMVWTVPTAAMQIPWSLVYCGIVLGMAAMLLALLGSLWTRAAGRGKERQPW